MVKGLAPYEPIFMVILFFSCTSLNKCVCWAQNTFCALQAVARHAKLESERLKGGSAALNGMDQEQWPLLALNLVQWHHRGITGVD